MIRCAIFIQISQLISGLFLFVAVKLSRLGPGIISTSYLFLHRFGAAGKEALLNRDKRRRQQSMELVQLFVSVVEI